MQLEHVCCLGTWTTLPHLLFKCDDVNDEESLENEWITEFGESPIDFITNVLINHKGPIHRFKIFYPYHFNVDCIEEWIPCLRNDIRELILKIGGGWDDDELNLLKSSIYSCAKLKRLELSEFKMDPPPSTFKGFLFLTTLALRRVELSPCGLETLVGNCPLLERLNIEHSSISELRILSPKLTDVRLSYVCNYPSEMQLVKFLLETSPGLETMELQLEVRSSVDDVSAELLGFRRASPNAQITII